MNGVRRMRSPSRPRVEVEWVVVPVSGVRKWGLTVFVLLLALGLGLVAWMLLHEPMEKKAARLIQQATAAEEDVRRAGISEGLAGEFEQGGKLLAQAKSDYENRDFPAAAARAGEALHRFELLLSLVNREFVGAAQIIAVSGKVDVQRANQTGWEKAKEKQALYNGDFLRTATDATAELLFADGTVYRVGPDSLLEIHREARGGPKPEAGEVKVKVGQVNVSTALNPSTVVTDTVGVRVHEESRVGVEVAEDATTTVAAYAGRARVTGASGEATELADRQAVTASREGRLSPRRAVPEPPQLSAPQANALINMDQGDRVTLSWHRVPGATSYKVQVSRSRLFAPANIEVEAVRNEPSVTLRLRLPGTYYWRVAAVGAERTLSEWSSPRSFRAYTGTRVEELADTTPPALRVQKPQQMGNLFLIQGVTEPGATVTINGEAVAVAGDGSFKKAVAINREGKNVIVIRATDAAGNTTEHRETVFVEVD
ncbi:MAG: FecR domain-containing protein [Thermoanaerobaculum sp.]